MGDEDKQFEASQQKLQKARKDGQVVKSKDFSMAVALMTMCVTVYNLAPHIWEQMSRLFILIYEQIPNKTLDAMGYKYILFLAIVPLLQIIAPILIVAAFVAILADLIQIGPLITTKPLEPKLDKLNPVKGFKNIFSMKSIVELIKNILKVTTLGFIGYIVFKAHIPSILALSAMDNTFSILNEFGSMIVEFVTKAGILFLVIAAGDYMYTKSKFLKDQKMSFKEVKDEHKNSEGDPHVKAALRQRRMQMAQGAAMDSVKTADFVTTNPTHVAVAVKYKEDDMQAPLVVAKGTELIAKKIIEIARENGVAVVENPPVARALFRLVEVNGEVPPELYKAVAEILLFVYGLKNKHIK